MADATITADEAYSVMRKAYDDLIEFVTTPAFQRVYDELYSLGACERPRYVEEVLLNPARLGELGVTIPEGVLIQRSSFGDRRPTLFCVKKYLPEHLHGFWQNVNITFDNEHTRSEVPRDAQAWRKPLPVDAQTLLIEKGVTAEGLGIG